ncbi:MAG: energy-coupling factor transporter ATPase [Bacillaceae bacterium]|nr:energy-coupling factor transporter ATPase [Bacillaceae bacterium]
MARNGQESKVHVEFDGVSHDYDAGEQGRVRALHDINLRIEAGQYMAIIGHNGSGKSTLARHINGLLLPTEGVVRVCGLDTRNADWIPEVRRRAGMVFQNPDNQLVAASVEDDIAFGLENMGLPPDEINRRIDEVLERLDIRELRHREPHQLSGGQKQRVAIAGIVAMKPEIIILDEATAMLDPAGRREVLDTVRHLNSSEGITVIHITHHVEETLDADYVVVMNEGTIVMQGEPFSVYSHQETLKQIGLDTPFTIRIQNLLKQKGLPIVDRGLQMDELVEAIWKSL